MGRIFRYFRDYKVLHSLCLARRANNKSKNRMSIKIARGAHFNVAKDAKVNIEGNGHLALGRACGKGICRATLLSVSSGAELTVHGDFSIFDNSRIYVRRNAHLVLGSGYVSSDAVIICTDRIAIGNGAHIADGVVIRDSDDHDIIREGYVRTSPICIGDHVWIGHGVTILKGVTIGDGAIIGAGSVVTKDIPAKSVAVGNPAKVVRQNVAWK